MSTSQVAIGTAIGDDWTTTGQQLLRAGVSLGAPAGEIEPRLADHVRREALKFVNELKRAV